MSNHFACQLVLDSTESNSDEICAWTAGSPRWQDRELGAIASSKGHREALTEAYTRYGDTLLEHIDGEFALVVFDRLAGTALAAVDRVGRYSLYHCTSGSNLVFGTTATGVINQLAADPPLEDQALFNYFYFHMVPSPGTAYANVSKLPAAHCLKLSAAKTDVVCYWKPTSTKRPNASADHTAGALKLHLERAVERAMASSEGAVGSFLSGGLDSSTVTGVLAALADRECPAYAIGFDEPGYDEMAYARISARHFGVELREYYVTPQDVVDELPKIAASYDEPFGNSSALPAYFCARKAATDGIGTLFAGDGGDEIFAGNYRYAKQKTFAHYRSIPESLRAGVIEPIMALVPGSVPLLSKLKSYVEQAKVPLPDRLQSYNYLNRISLEDMFSRDFLENVDTLQPLQLQRQTFNSLDDASDLMRMLYLDWQYTLADNDLRKVNRMCEIAGIEVRYPMLDQELIEFSCTIPDDLKLKGSELRYFFKHSLDDFLPRETLEKQKQGFGLPFGIWMKNYRPLNELANDCLSNLRHRGYFNADFLEKLRKMHQQDHAAYYGEFIWVLTILELWLSSRSGNAA